MQFKAFWRTVGVVVMQKKKLFGGAPPAEERAEIRCWGLGLEAVAARIGRHFARSVATLILLKNPCFRDLPESGALILRQLCMADFDEPGF